MSRKHFGEVFEGKGRNPTPLVSLRRLTDQEKIAANLPLENTVGIFWAEKMIACVDFDDLFDGEGNYFYNDEPPTGV